MATPPDIRERTIDRMKTLAESLKQIKTQRIQQIDPAAAANNVPAGQVPPEAIMELSADPSPQAIAEFNAVFGQGAAEAILGAR